MGTHYYTGKNILITGSSGFIGSQLARKLKDLGANVFEFSHTTLSTSSFIRSDLLDFSSLNNKISRCKIDICFHLAGVSSVESGLKDPYSTFDNNLIGMLNILEIARARKLEKVIIASSVQVYENSNQPISETTALAPSRPYETSKTCVDMMAQSYGMTFDMPILIPRFSNIYGPGDSHIERLMPKTVHAILCGKNPTMWGDGKIERDYLYVDDAVDAYVALGTLPKTTPHTKRILNIGSGTSVSVKHIIKSLISISGKNLTIRKKAERRTHEFQKQVISIGHAQNLIGWSPRVNLVQGLTKTYNWYRDRMEKEFKVKGI